MDNKDDISLPAKPASTDHDIDAAAVRLSEQWTRPGARGRGAGLIVQRLAHGRTHPVTLEIKRSPRRPNGSR